MLLAPFNTVFMAKFDFGNDKEIFKMLAVKADQDFHIHMNRYDQFVS